MNEHIAEHERKELNRLKSQTAPVDGLGVIKEAIRLSKTDSKEEQELFMKCINEGSIKAGELLTLRAIKEGKLTEDEWLEMKNRGWDFSDIQPVLLGYLEEMNDDDKGVILTVSDSICYKEQEFVQKRFGLLVKTMEEIVIEFSKDEEMMKEMLENDPQLHAGMIQHIKNMENKK